MADLSFSDLSFEKPNEGKIRVNFLKMFYFYIDESRLSKIGRYAISGKNMISFEGMSENNARNKFNFLLSESFKGLKNRMTNKSTYYIHKSSGIPLIGTNYFGLVDRGSNIIEVKPITSCNIGCIFCSVDEGPLSKRKADYVVEKDYLVDEFRKIVEFKAKCKAEGTINKSKKGLNASIIREALDQDTNERKPGAANWTKSNCTLELRSGCVPYGEAAPEIDSEQAEPKEAKGNARKYCDPSPNIDAHINAQGEPLLYADMVGLVGDIMSIPGVATSSIDTNGLLLTKQIVDDLAEAGLSRINLSLHAMDKSLAAKLAGFPYNLDKVLDIARYIPKTTMDLIIVPVWMPGYNDNELPKLAKFAVDIGAGKSCPPIGIQNLMNYRFGRNPVEEVPLDDFYKKMRQLEQEHGIKLIFDKFAFNIEDLPELPKPFRKGQTVEAEIMLPGRIGNEKLAVAKNRLISVPQCHYGIGQKVRVKIKRTKHNIFLGELLN